MREKTCCFTGHRDIPKSEIGLVMKRTEEYVKALVQRGVKFFGVGGALGYDALAAKLLFRLRASELPGIKVILVYPFDGYMDRWTIRQRADALLMKPKYDKIVKVSDEPGRDAYLQRDRHLVDGSAFCICYCTRRDGGTAYTVRYALSKGLKVFNTADFDVARLGRQ